MRVIRLKTEQYRNLEEIDFVPDDGLNVIYGNNGQGKTNLVEAIWMFTGCRSFRGTIDADLKNFDSEFSRLSLDFYASDRKQNAQLFIDSRRYAQINGVKQPSPTKLMGEFRSVVFAPSHKDIVEGGPRERRNFLDITLSQMQPRFAGYVSRYNKVLRQRNVLLKDIAHYPNLEGTLEIWNEKLAQLGAHIVHRRKEYLQKLRDYSKEVYSGISNKSETFDIAYDTNIKGDTTQEIQESLLHLLVQRQKTDLYGGTTSVGPHRDDMTILVDGISARDYGSQGQKKSSALALKLSEANMIEQLTGQKPVIILDDVMSELDKNRQDYILNHIDHFQVFITCCDPKPILRLHDGKTFQVENGRIVSES